MTKQPLFIVRSGRSGALYTPVPVDKATAIYISWRTCNWKKDGFPGGIEFVGYGIPYVGVFRR